MLSLGLVMELLLQVSTDAGEVWQLACSRTRATDEGLEDEFHQASSQCNSTQGVAAGAVAAGSIVGDTIDCIAAGQVLWLKSSVKLGMGLVMALCMVVWFGLRWCVLLWQPLVWAMAGREAFFDVTLVSPMASPTAIRKLYTKLQL